MIRAKVFLGDNLHSLIEFFKTTNSNFNEDFAVNDLKVNPFFDELLNGKVLPPPLSIMVFIAIIFLLNLSFVLPFMTIVFYVPAPVSVTAPLIFITVPIYCTLTIIAFFLLLKGRQSGMAIYHCMTYIGLFLFASTLVLIIFTDNHYWTLKIINICVLFCNRKLMNSQSFSEIIKKYIHMRLFLMAMRKLRRDNLTIDVVMNKR